MRRHLPRPAVSLGVVAGALALAASGCAAVPDGSVEAAAVACPEGSDCYDPPRAVGDGGSFSIEAGEFFFNAPVGIYWSGDIGVTLVNIGAAEHNIEFVGGGNEGSDPRVQALGGETADGVFNLFPGEYTYFCSIPGHRAQGMEGDLTVYSDETTATQELLTEG